MKLNVELTESCLCCKAAAVHPRLAMCPDSDFDEIRDMPDYMDISLIMNGFVKETFMKVTEAREFLAPAPIYEKYSGTPFGKYMKRGKASDMQAWIDVRRAFAESMFCQKFASMDQHDVSYVYEDKINQMSLDTAVSRLYSDNPHMRVNSVVFFLNGKVDLSNVDVGRARAYVIPVEFGTMLVLTRNHICMWDNAVWQGDVYSRLPHLVVSDVFYKQKPVVIDNDDEEDEKFVYTPKNVDEIGTVTVGAISGEIAEVSGNPLSGTVNEMVKFVSAVSDYNKCDPTFKRIVDEVADFSLISPLIKFKKNDDVILKGVLTAIITDWDKRLAGYITIGIGRTWNQRLTTLVTTIDTLVNARTSVLPVSEPSYRLYKALTFLRKCKHRGRPVTMMYATLSMFQPIMSFFKKDTSIQTAYYGAFCAYLDSALQLVSGLNSSYTVEQAASAIKESMNDALGILLVLSKCFFVPVDSLQAKGVEFPKLAVKLFPHTRKINASVTQSLSYFFSTYISKVLDGSIFDESQRIDLSMNGAAYCYLNLFPSEHWIKVLIANWFSPVMSTNGALRIKRLSVDNLYVGMVLLAKFDTHFHVFPLRTQLKDVDTSVISARRLVAQTAGERV